MDSPTSTTISLVSLGCPKNLVDSETILGELAAAGCVVSARIEDADVAIVNTCGFLAAAREESLAVISELVSLKQSGVLRRVVVAGCFAQRDGGDLRRQVPGVDAIIGLNDRDRLIQAVLGDGEFTANRPYAARRRELGRDVTADDTGRLRLTPRHTAYLRVSEGCSQGCSFCTIPAICGPYRSKDPEQVLAEARELIADGTVELNVIGQDTTSYGRDIGYDAGLAGLVRRLDALDGARWIRMMYAYPSSVTDAMIDAMADCEHVVKYLDLPLQHISDPILKAMRRGITRSQTERLLDRLRTRIENLAIRTTFIVGFPGETDAMFDELLTFVKAFGFDALGVFEYSRESGTPAARLDNEVPLETRRQRREQMMLAQQEIAFAANADCVGRSLTVLVDGVDPDGRCVARSAAQAPEVDSVCYLTDPRPAGELVAGVVTDWADYDLVVRPSPNTRRRRGRRTGAKR